MAKKYDLQEKIITLLQNYNNPLSISQICSLLGNSFNKTSIYRQMEKLSNLHIVSCLETSARSFYELRLDGQDHPHTHCLYCDKIVCLKNKQINNDFLEGEFDSQYVSLVVEGFCKTCKNRSPV